MKYGWEGYGLFWALLESMFESADAKLDAKLLRALCVRLSVTEEVLEEFVSYCVEIGLFKRTETELFSERLVDEKLFSIQKSESARRSAERRWKKGSSKPLNANALPTISEGNAPPTNQPTNQEPEKKANDNRIADLTSEQLELRIRRLAEERQWVDAPYIDKTLVQGFALTGKDRVEFMRKIRLLLVWSLSSQRDGDCRVLFHEIAGLVNDRGAMASKLTPQEKQAREIFREEMGQSLDEA